MNKLVVFTCDEINSFGLWNLHSGKVDTFPGQILYNERVVQLIPLGLHFLLVSQDRCCNIIVDLCCLTKDNKIKLMGCIGFITDKVTTRVSWASLELKLDAETSDKRKTKIIIKC